MYRKPLISDWKGVVNSSPAILLPPASFKSSKGWLIDKGRLYPFPNLVSKTPLPGPQTTYGLRTFQDQLGNHHTVFLSQARPYYLQQDASFLAVNDPDSNPFNPQLPNFFSIEVMLGRMFFANGGAPLSYVNGDAGFYTAGDVPGTSYYLGKLASHLMMVNCIEPVVGTLGSQNYPARIRFSASGNPFEWDSTIDNTAGVFEIADVEDALTGWATIGSVGFAFRNNGITSLTPTGVGALPFNVENFSIGYTGIGCYFPYTLAVYGPFCVFVALNDIYLFDGGAPQAIGGNAKKAIFADIESSVGPISAYTHGSLYKGKDYLSYWLSCPQSGGVVSMWYYHFDSKSWMNVLLQYGADVKAFSNVLLPDAY